MMTPGGLVLGRVEDNDRDPLAVLGRERLVLDKPGHGSSQLVHPCRGGVELGAVLVLHPRAEHGQQRSLVHAVGDTTPVPLHAGVPVTRDSAESRGLHSEFRLRLHSQADTASYGLRRIATPSRMKRAPITLVTARPEREGSTFWP